MSTEVTQLVAATEAGNVVPLIARLARGLDDAAVAYCHWKSNAALDRSLTAENDLDLLVDRTQSGAFRSCLHQLGFRLARPPAARQLPGVMDYYGYDPDADRVVHVHAHFQLVVGDDMTKNYRLPIEAAYLASSVDRSQVLPVPQPELEYLLLVLRLTLKHCPWDAQLAGQGRPTPSERAELAHLAARLDEASLQSHRERLLPMVDAALLDRCRRACLPGSTVAHRARAGHLLHRALAPLARSGHASDTLRKLARRSARRLRPTGSGKRLDTGGLIIAIVGGDGSGKSTTVEALHRSLEQQFVVQTHHLGKPPRSRVSGLVRRVVTAVGTHDRTSDPATGTDDRPAPPPNLVRCVGHVALARDRALEHRRIRRAAGNGAIVVCDRFPVPGLRSMDGPRCEALLGDPSRPFARWLAEQERRYYTQVLPPDLVIVLRVHPSVAVRRRPEQDPSYVYRRAAEVWHRQWDDGAVIIDAGRPLADVLDDVTAVVWEHL